MTQFCGDFGGTTRAGNPCTRPAGWGTQHSGEGKCKLHGGAATGRPLIHGRYAKSPNGRLGKKIREHMEDPNPLDLRPELALLRSLIDHFMGKLEEIEKDPTREDAGTFLLLIQGIQKVVDTISKVQTREALTANESMYLLVSLADILQTEIGYIRREEIGEEQALRHILGKLRSRVALPGLPGGSDILDV